MALSDDGNRTRYYHERVGRAARAAKGDPLQFSVSRDARRRIAREVEILSNLEHGDSVWEGISERITLLFGRHVSDVVFEKFVQDLSDEEFLSSLEIAAEQYWTVYQDHELLEAIQSHLADDLSGFRLREETSGDGPRFVAQRIDNQHLHAELVEKPFEVTSLAEFDSAQADYSNAWQRFTRGHFDDALVHASRAVESACKTVIAKVDPTKQVANAKLGAMVTMLVELEIIPSRFQPTADALTNLLRNSGALRNAAGVAHGSVDLTGPGASIALLGLRLSGALVAFLAERWTQMRPPRKRK